MMALFVTHFPKYVDFNSKEVDKLKIHIVGKSRLEKPLKKIISDSESNIEVTSSEEISEIPETDYLIVGRDYAEQMIDILQYTKQQELLIIGCVRGLEDKGAGINFFVSDNKVKFKLSKKAIKTNQLKVSSQLMRLAVIVE